MVDEKAFKKYLDNLNKRIDENCVWIGRELINIEHRKTTDDLKSQWEGIRNQERELQDHIVETLTMRNLLRELEMLED